MKMHTIFVSCKYLDGHQTLVAHRSVRLTRRISIISRYYLPSILSWGLVQERGDLLPVPISPLATIQDRNCEGRGGERCSGVGSPAGTP